MNLLEDNFCDMWNYSLNQNTPSNIYEKLEGSKLICQISFVNAIAIFTKNNIMVCAVSYMNYR
jgi:hypothetical protein